MERYSVPALSFSSPPVRSGDLLDDGVAVEVLGREGEQDVKGGGRQHAVNYSHCGYILQGYRRGAG